MVRYAKLKYINSNVCGKGRNHDSEFWIKHTTLFAWFIIIIFFIEGSRDIGNVHRRREVFPTVLIIETFISVISHLALRHVKGPGMLKNSSAYKE